MNNLSFNAQNHEYKLDGLTIPSVTQILKAEGLTDFSKVPLEILERNALFGTAVHKAVELKLRGTLDEDTLDVALKPYVEAWANFEEDFGYVHMTSEFQGFHPIYRYAYTIDLLGEITKGKFPGLSVGDIKTGIVKPADKIQLAGYKLAVGKEYKNVFAIYLNPDFQPRGYRVVFSRSNQTEQGIFLSALSLQNWKKQENLI